MSEGESNESQKILIRWKEGVEVYSVPPDIASKEGPCSEGRLLRLYTGSVTSHSVSSDGKWVALQVKDKGVGILSTEVQEEGVWLSDTSAVQCAYFSPLNTYVITWEKFKKGEGNHNLKVWKRESGELILGLSCKAIPKRVVWQQQQAQNSAGQWSVLQWTHDERFMMYGATSKVLVYSGEMKKFGHVNCENMSMFSVSPKVPNGEDGGYLVATFVPEAKGKPARVSLHSFDPAMPAKLRTEVVGKSFYQTEECSVQWSPLGNAALVLTQTTVDTTGQSYYGSANLYLFTTFPKPNAVQVPLPNTDKANILQDAAFNPNPNTRPHTFALISGKMPAMASLHSVADAEPTFLFGNAHRNTLIWAPHGRFLCTAGFGNLAGNLDFWDKNKLKQMPYYDENLNQKLGNKAHCAVQYGFSPDSRLFLVSTTSPRMNVDNKIYLYKYNGDGPLPLPPAFDNDRFLPDRLYSAEFLPRPLTAFPDRPQTPPPRNLPKGEDTPAPATTSAPSRYVPPAMRRSGSNASNSLAERMRQEREGSTTGPKKVTKASSVPGLAPVKKSIPGLAPVSTANKPKPKPKKQPKQPQPAPPPPEPEPAQTVDPEKRAKKIKKLLKQIDELKLRDEGDLNEDQKQKIKTEEILKKELQSIESSLK